MKIVLVLVLATCFFSVFMLYRMVAPFLETRSEQLRFDLLDDEMRQIEELTTRKSLYLDNLREIELDYELDRITEEDYRDLKRRYELKTVRIMRTLDELYGGRDWEERVERALGAEAGVLAAGALPDEDELAPKQAADAPAEVDQPEPLAAATAQTHEVFEDADDTIACPECGKQLEADARFCSRCGTALAPPSDEEPQESASRAV